MSTMSSEGRVQSLDAFIQANIHLLLNQRDIAYNNIAQAHHSLSDGILASLCVLEMGKIDLALGNLSSAYMNIVHAFVGLNKFFLGKDVDLISCVGLLGVVFVVHYLSNMNDVNLLYLGEELIQQAIQRLQHHTFVPFLAHYARVSRDTIEGIESKVHAYTLDSINGKNKNQDGVDNDIVEKTVFGFVW